MAPLKWLIFFFFYLYAELKYWPKYLKTFWVEMRFVLEFFVALMISKCYFHLSDFFSCVDINDFYLLISPIFKKINLKFKKRKKDK